MKVPVPSFVPVPEPEAMRLIAAVLLTAGLSLAAVGLACLFAHKRKGKGAVPGYIWALIGVGAVLAVDHGVQMLF
nr:hypothetical protein [uncultured Oscillibacter sp.]